MRNQNIFKSFFFAVALIFVFIIPSYVFAQCNQPDAPDCTCFNLRGPGGVWDPVGGGFIQDIAIQTVGTYESCNCETSTCSPTIKNSGQPYWQMVLGCNSEFDALLIAWAMSISDDIRDLFHHRVEWCSETISYWHREADVPYTGGYRAGWHMNWEIYSVVELKRWYQSEDWVNPFGTYGGGKWIEPDDVDYDNFELGVTVPVPGAYVAIRGFDYGPPERWEDMDYSHSLMINEMWVHREASGDVCRVEVSLLEGNSGKEVKDTRDPWENILLLTPKGSRTDWVGHSRGPDETWHTDDDIGWKIYGFGIDRNSDGEPIYDTSRLHDLTTYTICPPDPTQTVQAADIDWDEYSQIVPQTMFYAKRLNFYGGPTALLKVGLPSNNSKQSVMSSLSEVQVDIPNGRDIHLDFAQGSPLTELEIDLLEVHPIPIRGIELVWDGSFIPSNYIVQFGGADQQYQDATTLDLTNANLPYQSPTMRIPAMFTDSGTGVAVGYVRLIFPEGTFQQDAKLLELRFFYEESPWEDTEDIPIEINKVFVDVKPGSCPNPLNLKSKGVLPVAILGTEDFDVTKINPESVKLKGVSPLRWKINDVATPYTSLIDKEFCTDCNEEGPDGFNDLTLSFKRQEIVEALGEVEDGECLALELSGTLLEEFGGTPFTGEDVVRLLKKGKR